MKQETGDPGSLRVPFVCCTIRVSARIYTMKRVAWLTDLHLNFLDFEKVDAFLERVAATNSDAVIISGDITESTELISVLRRVERTLARPIYFVLGNHDYYFSSLAEVRRRVDALCQTSKFLKWLNTSGIVRLTSSVALLGHDGWADGRLGDYERSLVAMNDWRLIEELAGLAKEPRWEVLKRLADEAAEHIRRLLPTALDRFAEAVLVTHVPPFRGACWHEGHISNDEWLPHFSDKAVGDAIVEVMSQRHDRRLTVLCGHTHGKGTYQPLDNVTVLTGGAIYGEPEIQRVLEFEP